MRGIKLGDKETKYPIVQGGMGVGVSLHKLAGNVSKEGGIGVISTANIGYQENDFNKNPLEANLRAIGSEIKKAREIAEKNGFVNALNGLCDMEMAEYEKLCGGAKEYINKKLNTSETVKEYVEVFDL